LINGKKVVAIVTARGGSKGLPRKNKKVLAGKPLVTWPIEAAVMCNHVDRVLLSTDCTEIADIGRLAGAEVISLRPEYLASDQAKSVDVILHVLEELKYLKDFYDYVVMLEPTSPLTDCEDISKALLLLERNQKVADSVVGIAAIEATHPEYAVKSGDNGILQPAFATDFSTLRRRQDVEELYFLEGTLYASEVSALEREKNFYHSRTMGFKVPRWKSFEVDEMVDFICIEAILANLNKLDS
tara:strand:+ start:917 stop:1642 length:726 start_codon:yes stop_codon:yes gene_type:complete